MSLDAGDDSDDGQKFDRILIQRISTELEGGDRERGSSYIMEFHRLIR